MYTFKTTLKFGRAKNIIEFAMVALARGREIFVFLLKLSAYSCGLLLGLVVVE